MRYLAIALQHFPGGIVLSNAMPLTGPHVKDIQERIIFNLVAAIILHVNRGIGTIPTSSEPSKLLIRWEHGGIAVSRRFSSVTGSTLQI